MSVLGIAPSCRRTVCPVCERNKGLSGLIQSIHHDEHCVPTAFEEMHTSLTNLYVNSTCCEEKTTNDTDTTVMSNVYEKYIRYSKTLPKVKNGAIVLYCCKIGDIEPQRIPTSLITAQANTG